MHISIPAVWAVMATGSSTSCTHLAPLRSCSSRARRGRRRWWCIEPPCACRVEGGVGRRIRALREPPGATFLQVRVDVRLHPVVGHDRRRRHGEIGLPLMLPPT